MAHWAGRRCQLATAHGTKWTDSTKNCVDGLLRLFLYIPHLGFQGLIFGFFGFAKGSFRNRKFGTTTRAPPKKGAQSLLVCCFVPKLWGKTLIQSWEGVGGLSLVSFTSWSPPETWKIPQSCFNWMMNFKSLHEKWMVGNQITKHPYIHEINCFLVWSF